MEQMSFLPGLITRRRAIECCDTSIRKMMRNYKKFHNCKYPALIRKRIKLLIQLKSSRKRYFTGDELGLISNKWLLSEIGYVSSMIVRSNTIC